MRETEFSISGARFDPSALAESGQLFRVLPSPDGGILFLSGDKAARVTPSGEDFLVATDDPAYFRRFFDEDTDYEGIWRRATSSGVPLLEAAARFAPRLRVARGEPFETVFSFLVSQNNHIPRIRGFLFRLCEKYGREIGGGDVPAAARAFPRPEELPTEAEDYARLGAGYRAEYLASFVRAARDGWLGETEAAGEEALLPRLLALRGAGPKVADCAALFAWHRTERFPVDTWIYRAYREMGGTAGSARDASRELSERFGADSGYFQQYLFYYKRKGENA